MSVCNSNHGLPAQTNSSSCSVISYSLIVRLVITYIIYIVFSEEIHKRNGINALETEVNKDQGFYNCIVLYNCIIEPIRNLLAQLST